MKPIIEREKYYSAEEAANLCRVQKQTITNKLRTGEVEGEKRGPKKKWFTKGSSIEKILIDYNIIDEYQIK